MGLIEIILIGIGLAMDAFAVALGNAIAYPLTRKHRIGILAFFGGFQGLMPILGYYACGFFSDFIQKYTGLVVFFILAVIGGNMLYSGLKGKEEKMEDRFTLKVLFIQAIATSLDAFAVGITLHAGNANIIYSSVIIAVTTALVCFSALLIGRKCNALLGKKAEVLGGVILIAIGIKALF